MDNRKRFYETHINFSNRTFVEYHISPGIRAKFKKVRSEIQNKLNKIRAIDLGSSGNSILLLENNIEQKVFLDIANQPLKNYKKGQNWNPICGDIEFLPLREKQFEYLSVLDVLEHLKNDKLAIKEVLRILKSNGVVCITVPHNKKRFNSQDELIGHYRRYDIRDIIKLVSGKAKLISIFNVYGRLMNISLIQPRNPNKIENSIQWLRDKYLQSNLFRAFWNIIVKISALIMRTEANLCPRQKVMNIGFVFKNK